MRIAIVGLGHLGQIHIKCIKETEFELVGCYDIKDTLCLETADKNGIKAFESFDALLKEVDAVDIVSTSSSHFMLAKQALLQKKHLFIEKPFVENMEQAKEIKKLADINNCLVQIGFVERYNPAIRTLENTEINAKFIEAHRLSMFNPRGSDVSVVMDLMIHDLDLVCHFIKSELDFLDANGVSILNDSPDICSARLVFKNGAVANLTASRISLKNMRKFRIFEGAQYISLDLLEKSSQVVQIKDNQPESENGFTSLELETVKGKKYVSIKLNEGVKSNAIQNELSDFYLALKEGQEIKVNLSDAIRSLELANLILTSIEENNRKQYV